MVNKCNLAKQFAEKLEKVNISFLDYIFVEKKGFFSMRYHDMLA